MSMLVLALFAALTPTAPVQAAPVRGAAEPLPLDRLFDNTAVSDDARPGEADFDGTGAPLPAADLTAAGWTP